MKGKVYISGCVCACGIVHVCVRARTQHAIPVHVYYNRRVARTLFAHLPLYHNPYKRSPSYIHTYTVLCVAMYLHNSLSSGGAVALVLLHISTEISDMHDTYSHI